MDKESLKILAMVESLILWDYLDRTGEESKEDAIEYLYSQNKISLPNYLCSCPFCEVFWRGRSHCDICLWPGNNDMDARCDRPGSPFLKWKLSKTKNKHKNAAKKVLDMLLQIPMD